MDFLTKVFILFPSFENLKKKRSDKTDLKQFKMDLDRFHFSSDLRSFQIDLKSTGIDFFNVEIKSI